MPNKGWVLFSLCFWLMAHGRAANAGSGATSPRAQSWNPTAAASYLDERADWWVKWDKAQRDHETTCVSCHTVLPYVLSRSVLRKELHEKALPRTEQMILANVRKRVRLWNEVQPYYLDAKSGPGKSKESRSTEAVLNALVLANEDRLSHQLSKITLDAFNAAWGLQLASGTSAGAWDWQVFKLAPWEAAESQYAGATWMALAVGWAPQQYQKSRPIQSHVQALKTFLRAGYAQQPLINKVSTLWASEYMRDLLAASEKRDLLAELCAKQKQDGGWNLASLGAWTRRDQTAQDAQSDALATALISLALESSREKKALDARQNGLAWLRTHQETDEGSWRAYSLNKQRDPKSDVGRFMSDAATGYAVLALQQRSR